MPNKNSLGVGTDFNRPSKPMHFDFKSNEKNFNEAYQSIIENPGVVYSTNFGTSFLALAAKVSKGNKKDQSVIIFKNQKGKEVARSYECCWGHKTNCNRTYIDSYTNCV